MTNKLDSLRISDDKKLVKELEQGGNSFLIKSKLCFQQSSPKSIMSTKNNKEYFFSPTKTFITFYLILHSYHFSVESNVKFHTLTFVQ